MKKVYLIPACWIAVAAIFISWYVAKNPRGTGVSVTDSNTSYKMDAYYHSSKTPNVARYIDSCLEPAPLLFDHDFVQSNVTLEDSIHFLIKHSAGKLLIEAQKKDNSPASLERIKQLCTGIKETIFH